jgi:protein arginine kinase activator
MPRPASPSGCAACYGAFADHLDRVFAEIHHGNRHIGRHPAGNVVDAQARIAERLRLRKRLDQALASEDYRLAAELRDALKTAESGE